MKNSTTLLITACAAPALWAFTAPADRVAFTVAEGSSITKTFTSSSDMALEDMTMAMNGEEIDMAMMGGDLDMNVSQSQTVQVTDDYVAVAGARPSTLKRTYDTLSSETSTEASGGPMMGGDTSMSAGSELEGMTVVFEWDAENEDYTASFAEGSEGDDELLEDLFEDMDLRELLPDDEVSEGDSWEIDTNTLLKLIAPGGNLKIVPEEVEDMGMPMPGAMNPFDTFGEFEGTFTGEYGGQRDVDGTKVAVIKLTIDASSTNDMTDFMAEMMEEMEMPEGMPDMEIEYDSVDMEFEFSGTGELLWDLSAGHYHALDLSGEMLMAMDMSYSMAMQGMDMSMDMSMEMSGTQNLSASIGAAE